MFHGQIKWYFYIFSGDCNLWGLKKHLTTSPPYMKHKWCRIEQRQNSESFGDQLNQARKWWEQCNSFPEPKFGSPCCFTWGRMTRVVVPTSTRVVGRMSMAKAVVSISRHFSGLLPSKGPKINALVILVLVTLAAPTKALCPQFCQVFHPLWLS